MHRIARRRIEQFWILDLETHTRTHQFDVSELKAEKSMAPSDELIKLVMRADPFGNWRFDVASQQVWWSPNVYAIHGIKPESGPVDINTAIDAYHPDDAISVGLLIDHAIENKKGFDFVMRLNRTDGSLRFVQSIASVETDGTGRVTAVFGIFKDITDRISEQRVADMNRQLIGSIIYNSPTPLVILDQDMNYLQVSPSWLEFHSLGAPHEFECTSHYDAFPDIPEAWKEEHQRALRGEVIHRNTAGQTDFSDEYKGYGTVIFPWRNASKKIGGLVMMVTTSSKSKAENAAAAGQIAELYQRSESETAH